MRLVSYRHRQGEARLGVLHNGMVVDVERLAARSGHRLPADMLGLIDAGSPALALLAELLEGAGPTHFAGATMGEGNVTILAPIPRPRKNIFGIGLNYTEHVAESARALDTSGELPKQPIIFSKPPTAVISATDSIPHDESVTKQLDWETELAVIIGHGGRRISTEDALDHVFGYTIINDISARDCRRAGQWIVSKGQDGFAPMGPCIVTADEIPDPQALNLWTRVNGIEKQNASTSLMLFSVRELIADVSRVMTLEPGDIIATGTPSGVGAGREPQEWMWPGDVLESYVEKIGTMRNPIVRG